MKLKKIITTLFVSLFLIGSLAIAPIANASVKVKGYTKKSGAYVMPYHKTSPNKTKFDNYSTKGNVNPYTGKKGTQSPYKSFKIKKLK